MESITLKMPETGILSVIVITSIGWIALRKAVSWIRFVLRNDAPHFRAERTPSGQRSLRCQVRSVRLRERRCIARNVHVGHGSSYLLLRQRNVAHCRETDEELDGLSLASGLTHICIEISE